MADHITTARVETPEREAAKTLRGSRRRSRGFLSPPKSESRGQSLWLRIVLSHEVLDCTIPNDLLAWASKDVVTVFPKVIAGDATSNYRIKPRLLRRSALISAQVLGVIDVPERAEVAP